MWGCMRTARSIARSRLSPASRPQVADEGLLCDLLWSDPDPETRGWGANLRGVSYTFGHDVIAEFLAKNDLDLICRAHQVRESLGFKLKEKVAHKQEGALVCSLEHVLFCISICFTHLHLRRMLAFYFVVSFFSFICFFSISFYDFF